MSPLIIYYTIEKIKICQLLFSEFYKKETKKSKLVDKKKQLNYIETMRKDLVKYKKDFQK